MPGRSEKTLVEMFEKNWERDKPLYREVAKIGLEASTMADSQDVPEELHDEPGVTRATEEGAQDDFQPEQPTEKQS